MIPSKMNRKPPSRPPAIDVDALRVQTIPRVHLEEHEP
jgi:hypothetical protein